MNYLEPESLVKEYKKSLSQLKEGIISLSAMLNKSEKGELYFGIGPDLRPYKMTISNKTTSDISTEIRNNLKPCPTKLEIEKIIVEGIEIIKVYAEGKETPYSAYGRYYLRLDDGDIPMTVDQLKTYFDNKQEDYSAWENKPTNLTFADIDEKLLIKVIEKGNRIERIKYEYQNVKEAMTKLNLLTEDGRIKMAGYYLFGKNEPILIKEAIFPTDSVVEFGDLKQFKGNIFECIDEADSYLKNHILFKSDIVGLTRIETPEIPLKAIREIVVNSFAHCRYSSVVDNNKYAIFRSFIRIYNAGGIYKNIDPKEFATAKKPNKIRNPLICNVLYIAGVIDSFGTGFTRVFNLCKESGVKIKYRSDESGFTFVFKRIDNFLLEKRTTLDENDTLNVSENVSENVSINYDDVDRAIIMQIQANKRITLLKLAELLNITERTVVRRINKLKDLGVIRRVGNKQTGHWAINNRVNNG